MFFMKLSAAALIAAVSALAFAPSAHAERRVAFSVSPDEVFLALRDAARRDDALKAAELASRLSDYPIPSYVEYYRLKPRIKDAPVAEIRDFLARHDGSAIADRLRNDWLLELGRARDWAAFDEQYPQFVLKDDTQLKCYALLSRLAKTENVAEEARALLVSPKDYGDACPALITSLAQAGQFNPDDVWSQVRLAAENGFGGLARRIAAAAESADQVAQAVDKPSLVLTRRVGIGRAAHEAFIIALGQAARSSPEQAVRALEGATDRLTLHQQALGWSMIAQQASLRLVPEAVDYWRKAGKAPLSTEGHQWKVRMALRAGDWKLVKSGIEAMPAALQNDPAWVYWLGRALRAQNRPEDAQELFKSIAGLTSFYGQLALEELGQKITIPAQAQSPTAEEIAAAAANRGFRRAFKLLELNLRFEGYREWNWQLRKMTDRELLAAAEFARQSNFLDRMVNTSDRTLVEVDFTQRFPSPYDDVMRSTTQVLGLDRAWVYGLIRQESRFILTARSQVGASGLMQLMPATARYVARRIGMSDFSQGQVNDINTNIVLGTNYLSMVLNDLDGSQAMATAAYNAGPSRPRAWRSTLTRTVEGAVFAESIPFSETRGYVKNVLSNATYYAALFENQPQSLKARLGTVTPKGFTPTDLP
jgi:soluble lytic murein transglycosylase